MPTTITVTAYLHPPLMLNDLAENFQHLSARLPLDSWVEPGSPCFYLQRQESGILSLLPTDDGKSWLNSLRASKELGREWRENNRLLVLVKKETRTESGQGEAPEVRKSFWTRIFFLKRQRSLQKSITTAQEPKQKISASLYQRAKARILDIWRIRKRVRNKNGRASIDEPLLQVKDKMVFEELQSHSG